MVLIGYYLLLPRFFYNKSELIISCCSYMQRDVSASYFLSSAVTTVLGLMVSYEKYLFGHICHVE